MGGCSLRPRYYRDARMSQQNRTAAAAAAAAVAVWMLMLLVDALCSVYSGHISPVCVLRLFSLPRVRWSLWTLSQQQKRPFYPELIYFVVGVCVCVCGCVCVCVGR